MKTINYSTNTTHPSQGQSRINTNNKIYNFGKNVVYNIKFQKGFNINLNYYKTMTVNIECLIHGKPEKQPDHLSCY